MWYVHVPKQLRQKWDSKAKEGIFVRYSNEAKGLKIWFKERNKIEVHRDIYFVKGEELITDPKEKQNKEIIDFQRVKINDKQEEMEEVEKIEDENEHAERNEDE